MRLEFREIANGLQFPEGPVELPDGAIALVEVASGLVVRIGTDGRKETLANVGGGPNGAALGPDGNLYICQNGGFEWIKEEDGYLRPIGRAADYRGGGIQRVSLTTGKVEMLYTHCNDVPLTGPNDIVFDDHGGFYFTDHGKSYGRLMDRGAIFYASANGDFIREVVFPCITPNGVGLSPEGTVLYATETETGRLWAWPLVSPGVVAKEPWPSLNGGQFIGGTQSYQRFDSLAVEANGNVCVASLMRGGISVFSPNGGLVEFHEAPEPYCTNICFGGQDMRTAYITLSGYGRLIAVDWLRPGLKLSYPTSSQSPGAS